MAKFYGSIVKTGRVGGSVFCINRGTTIERQYQPVVSNPSTALQVEQRAKMKLASQLSAILAPELGAFGRDGMQSSRNLFVKDLFGREAIVYLNNKATLSRGQLRLTTGRINMLSSVTAVRQDATTTLRVAGAVRPEYQGSILGVRIVVIQAAGVAGDEAATLTVNGATVVPENNSFTLDMQFNPNVTTTVLVYGFVPESEAAVTRYRSLVAQTGNVELSLDVVRRLVASGLQYSETSNITVLAQ